MVTADTTKVVRTDVVSEDEDIVRIDGAEPITSKLIAQLTQACDHAEAAGTGRMIVSVSGTPGESWPHDLTVTQVNRWERAVRRMERLPAATVAVADGACGGPALDVYLAADIRIATASASLAVTVRAGATWPGMAVFRLIRQSANAAAARRAALFGEPISAADAAALHLADVVTDNLSTALAAARGAIGAPGTFVPADGFPASAFAGPEIAIRRQLIADALNVPYEEAVGVHLAACDRELRRLSAERAS
jgi:isomerase DpgB